MSKVKIGFSRLDVTNQVARARDIVTNMTGNADYPTPSPSLPDITSAADALELAWNESRGRDKDKVAIMRLRRKELLFLIAQLSAYVQQASDGDEEKILGSGFDVRASNTPRPDIAGDIASVRLKDGLIEGKIMVEWDAATDAVLYLIETSATSEFTTSELAGGTTKTQKEIGPFASGSTVWVRVSGFGREDRGNYSTPVAFKLR